MSADLEMEQILGVFLAECAEGLQVIESGLITLDANADRDSIDTIFRAAHSIKGGAGMFGFTEISQFTHSVETLLDQMRAGSRPVTPEAVQVLFEAVDVIREMTELARAKQPIVSASGSALTKKIEELLARPADKASGSQAQPSHPSAAASPPTVADETGWRIEFRPDTSLFKTCNDPLRIFSELRGHGPLEVAAHSDELPPLSRMDPTLCYLRWSLILTAPVTQPQLTEAFDWVDANSTIRYEPLQPPASRPAPAETQTEEAPATLAAPSGGTTKAAAAPQSGPVDEPAATPKASPRAAGDSGSIRVATEKLDLLINLVGELVITQSMLSRFSENYAPDQLESLRRGLSHLSRNTRELQESVLKIRMLPISFSFNRFPRLVHELSRKLGKKVELRLSGENTELDKIVLEKIGDPLVHLVRNSLDHGLEMPEQRIQAGKSETGILELNAFHEGGNVIIEVKDDGAGLNKERILTKARERGLVEPNATLNDEQIHDLIFAAGFSTAETVSDVSGRGVGMDVVRRNINDLGGHVQISSSAGKGSTTRIRLPLTLAILEGQMLRVGSEVYVISLVSIIETVQPRPDHIHSISGRASVFKHRGEYLPVIPLRELFDIEQAKDLGDGLLIVAETDGRRVAILVDELLAQQQVVIKSLDTNFRTVPGIAGATIHGDGTVALILDVPGLIGRFLGKDGRPVELAA